MSENKSVTANFTLIPPTQYTLSVNTTDNTDLIREIYSIALAEGYILNDDNQSILTGIKQVIEMSLFGL